MKAIVLFRRMDNWNAKMRKLSIQVWMYAPNIWTFQLLLSSIISLPWIESWYYERNGIVDKNTYISFDFWYFMNEKNQVSDLFSWLPNNSSILKIKMKNGSDEYQKFVPNDCFESHSVSVCFFWIFTFDSCYNFLKWIIEVYK